MAWFWGDSREKNHLRNENSGTAKQRKEFIKNKARRAQELKAAKQKKRKRVESARKQRNNSSWW